MAIPVTLLTQVHPRRCKAALLRRRAHISYAVVLLQANGRAPRISYQTTKPWDRCMLASDEQSSTPDEGEYHISERDDCRKFQRIHRICPAGNVGLK